MDLREYRDDIVNKIKAKAIEDEVYPYEAFIDFATDIMVDDYSWLSGLEKCYLNIPAVDNKYKSMHIDAGSLELSTNSVNLLIQDFDDGELREINNAQINANVASMLNYFENILKGYFLYGEQADPAVQLARDIKRNLEYVYKIHLFIVSTNQISKRVKPFNKSTYTFNGVEYRVELDILDMDKIYNAKLAVTQKEDTYFKTEEFGIDGIPCIKADIESDNYEAYLAVVPGRFLSDIYKEYGPRLLEGNVRSFLQFRGGVNKGIRGTILNEKDRFFTYNNGISTTAKDIEIENIPGKGLCITAFKALQIINGGQTTASLAAASIRDKADLSGIFVQMKLTIVKVKDEEFIRNISKYANSQNKVTAADLNSNHPFYTKIEDFSNRILAPATGGRIYQTHWFFERSRGQYEQPKIKMKKGSSELATYERLYPADQKFDKTDLAKYINSAEMQPFNVAWGKEVNATKFQAEMEKQWEKDKTVYNEKYFRDLIAKAILFNKIRKTILSLDWYKENKGYLAQLITYTFSKLVYETTKLGKILNYKYIWDKQDVPDFLVEEIAQIAETVSGVFRDPNKTNANIETYCKSKQCWDAVAVAKYSLSDETVKFLTSKEDNAVAESLAKKEQKFANGIDNEIGIFQKGSAYWETLIKKGTEQKVLNPYDVEMLQNAVKYCNFVYIQLSPRQIKAIGLAVEKLAENGIPV